MVASTIATMQEQMAELKHKSKKFNAHIKKLIKAQELLSKSSVSKESTVETLDKNDSVQVSTLPSNSDSGTISTLQTINKNSNHDDDNSTISNASGNTTSAGNRK